MTRLARAFLAAVPPPAVLDALEARVRPVAVDQTRLRWLPRSQWHVTLQFLGPVEDAEALAAAVGAAAATREPCTQRLAGSGAFPGARRASVLWVGVDEAAGLADLAAALGAATAPLGHAPEARPYHPHLTVARANPPRAVRVALEGLAPDPIGPSWTVHEVALVQSDTRADGARHAVWRRLPLGGA